MNQRSLIVPVIDLQVYAVRTFNHCLDFRFHDASIIQANDDGFADFVRCTQSYLKFLQNGRCAELAVAAISWAASSLTSCGFLGNPSMNGSFGAFSKGGPVQQACAVFLSNITYGLLSVATNRGRLKAMKATRRTIL